MYIKQPLISIIIPVYNVEPYLRRCLDSVINQTYKNLEIILIDDGSTDKSGEICEEYKKKDNRIIVIHQKNQGVSAARNAGLDIFKGEYVSFIDSDDYVDLRFIEELYKIIQKYKTDISLCGIRTMLLNGQFELSELYEGLYTPKQYFNDAFQPSWNKLYKRSLFLNVRFPAIKISEDIEVIYYKFLAKNKTISGTGAILYNYCQRAGSVTYYNADRCAYKFHYSDLEFVSRRLMQFYKNFSKEEINIFFKECNLYFIAAIKSNSTLYKEEGLLAYYNMSKTIYRELTFKNRLTIKFPKLYVLYRKIKFLSRN